MGGVEDFGLLHRPFLCPDTDCLLRVLILWCALLLVLVARAWGTI